METTIWPKSRRAVERPSPWFKAACCSPNSSSTSSRKLSHATRGARDAPAERLAILCKALVGLAADKSFLDNAKRAHLDVGLMRGEAVEAIIKKSIDDFPDAVTRFVGAISAP